jgi:soluble lytic murein transglycosylase-like protein
MLRLMPYLLLAALVLPVSAVRADVYKYLDAKGNVYFTDAPLAGPKYRLAWKRESAGLVNENRDRLARLGRNLGRLSAASFPRPPVSAVGKGVPAGLSGRTAFPASAAAPTSNDQTLTARRARFERVINAYARLYGLSPDLLHAVIRTESAYNHEAVSRAGAEGLMQLMPGTAARYGVKDSFNPVENIRGGAAYLRDLLDLFGQDLRLALAGYNAGENAVIRNGNQIPPYSETQNYVRQVLQHFWSARGGG